MPTATLPLYIDDLGHGLQVPQIPAGCDDCTLFSFFLAADHGAMQALVDKFLNAPAQGAVTYRVIGAHAMLTFSYTARHYPIPQVIGYLSDYECAFWIPLLAQGGGSDRIVYWMPYLFISWAEGMATGREIWGFRKEVGTITMPQPGEPANFSCIGRVFDPLAQDTKGVDAPVVTIRGPGALPPFTKGVFHFKELLETMVGYWRSVWSSDKKELPVGEIRLMELMGSMMLSHHVPIVNLKQFRDAADSTRACYQALIECNCTTTQFDSWGLLEQGYLVDVPSYASHRIASDLGLPGVAGIPVAFGAWAKLSFTADAGREVWRAAT